ncbi:MAG TPA: SH3 domain-containing protein [Kiritimatiellia bacterium]|nr:SH3 domain-containing protein [Kiritimatiellia bacterium]
MNSIKFLFCAAALAAAAASAQTPVRVTADNVNLRAKAQLTAEVVAQAAYDERLAAYEIGDEWVEVAAPEQADLWVTKSYVQQPANTIGANRVNVRAGPGINYNVVCTLALGEKVEPRGEEVAEWLKIAPPAAARLWISRDYVEIVPAAAPEAEKAAKIGSKKTQKAEKEAEIAEKEAQKAEKAEKSGKKGKTKDSGPAEPAMAPETLAPPPADLPTPIVAPSVPEKDVVVREIPVPPPADLKLIPLEGQGRLVEVSGELRAAPLINEAPTRYRVVRWLDNRWQILCHVYGEASKFRSLQGKPVLVKGRQYWIQGAAAPVLVPDQVQELSAVE